MDDTPRSTERETSWKFIASDEARDDVLFPLRYVEREIESKKIMFQDHRVPTDHSKLGFVDLE